MNSTRHRPTATKPVPPPLGMPFATGPANALTTASQNVILPSGSDVADRSLGRLAYTIYQFDRYFRLPDGPRSFAIFMIALVLVIAGMVVQVLLSAQILQAEARLQTIQKEFQILQQQNSEFIWQISRETNLQRARARVADQGYRAVTAYNYVVLPGPENVMIPSPDTAQDVADARLEASGAETAPAQSATLEPAVASIRPANNLATPFDGRNPVDVLLSDAPLDRWLGLLLPSPDKPALHVLGSQSPLEPPGQWWRNIWQQSRDQVGSMVENVQNRLTR